MIVVTLCDNAPTATTMPANLLISIMVAYVAVDRRLPQQYQVRGTGGPLYR